MVTKMKALFELFKAGRRVNDPAKWKARQIESSVIVAVLWAAINTASAFGYEIVVSQEVIDGVAVALLAVVNVVLTITTTNKIGLPSEPKS